MQSAEIKYCVLSSYSCLLLSQLRKKSVEWDLNWNGLPLPQWPLEISLRSGVT